MATEEQKKAAQLERDSIKVTNTNKPAENAETAEEKNNEEEEIEKEDDETDDDKSNKENTGEDDSSNEDNDDKEKEEEVVETKSIEKLEKTIARLQKRVDKKSGSEKELQKQLNDLKAQLEAKQAAGETVLTEEDVQARAERIAADKVTEREFTRACNKLAADATKIDKKFDDKVKDMADEIGPIPPVMIGVLEDLDNGGAILAHLVNNVEDAEELYSLPLVKMVSRLNKLSTELLAKAKPKRPISNVPEPNEPVTASSKTVAFDPTNTKMTDKEWIEKRNRQVADRAAAKRAALR